MKLLAERVNVIPVIGKADTLTRDELAHYKRKVREAITKHQIAVFQKAKYADAGSSLPFAVASCYSQAQQFKRVYPWGTFDGATTVFLFLPRFSLSLILDFLNGS